MKIGIRIDSLTFEKARRDITKLVPKVITDKNGHQRKVYAKLGIPIKKDMKVNKERWNSSTEKAKELKISDFGTPEEVREMAKMPRIAVSYSEARAIMEGLVQKPIKSKSGIYATISKKSIDKILSGDAVKKSSSYKAHLLASVNVDILVLNSIEKWSFEMNQEKNNQGLQERKYLYAPMEYSGRIIPVKFTIKQFTNSEKGTRIYSLEAIDVDIKN